MQRMAQNFPEMPRLTDAAAVIAASDCVYIASPPASHLGHARASLAAGKSFFGEKPLSVDVADARAFVAEAGNRGAVNFPFASSFAVASIRDWIDKGEIGTPQRIWIEVGFQGLAPSLAGRCRGLARQANAGWLHARGRLAFPVPGAAPRRTPARTER